VLTPLIFKSLILETLDFAHDLVRQVGRLMEAMRETPGPSALVASREGALDFTRWCFRILRATVRRFLDHDGWAIASHIALSALMSLFPFLIIVTALAGISGSSDLADEVARIMLEAWPAEVAGPIAAEARSVLTVARTDVLTIGAVAALYFASSGIEAVRIGLNRAYQAYDWRPWWLTRLESIIYVIFGAAALLIFAVAIVFAPILWRAAIAKVPALEQIGPLITLVRFVVAIVVIIVGLLISHLLLPGGRRSLASVLPGVIVTLVLWIVSGTLFGSYLDSFAFAYVSMYAGLATAMIALVFLYLLGVAFLFGGELNAALAEDRAQRDPVPAA
jgi:membrane protein